MTGAREEILARIRRATADLPATAVAVPRAYLRHAPGVDPEDRTAVLDLFAERLGEYGAAVHRTDAAAVAPTLASALPAGRAVVPRGFPAQWLADWSGTALADEPLLTREQLDAADAVVTTCAAAIADSGTLVLDAGPGQGRRAATLLPDLHLCVVRADQVVSAMPEAIGLLDPRRPLTWISGPSATADIEMIRVQGVHGPRRLTVLLVEDSDVSDA
ncbi:LutC/YkgG family protein [Streptacidiphilus jiangxiensis]|uniref:L-lactate dehydrogenase complex protein LldG n=1 Tax=Streptacidiphilus jiangxiensis TaxID=235985 RepID=A0A1H7TJ32_STRJI|nr:LUD domain-containing protein [Streptacidiphilus jiangxiensis]SEL84830.1 L-lactate dehydrogenase complex protein LldG [Streptacidiphilus jiangxiensis]